MLSSHKISNFCIKLIRILLQIANKTVGDVLLPSKITTLQLVSAVASPTAIITDFASHLLLRK